MLQVARTSKCHLHGLYNNLLVLNRHTQHLSWLVIVWFINNKETFMWVHGLPKPAKSRWQGNLQELKVEMLIATSTNNDRLGHQFWISKVVNVVTLHESISLIKSIKVQWYNTRSKNEFTGKYTLSRGNKRRKRNIWNTLTLDINEVDIIVYDFTLTKVGCLRKPTINIIKVKLPSLQGFSDRRRSRSDEPNSESHHFVLDEDNALIGISEDD